MACIRVIQWLLLAMVAASTRASVVTANKETMQRIQDTDETWFLLFCPKGLKCNGSSAFRVAGNYMATYLVHFGVVDCELHPHVCTKMLPPDAGSTILYFNEPGVSNPYSTKTTRMPKIYPGKRTTKALKGLVAKKMPNYVTVVSKMDEMKEAIAENFEANQNIAMVVTDKEKVSPFVKMLAIEFRGRLTVVQASGESMMEALGVTDSPILAVLNKTQNGSKAFDFDGILSKDTAQDAISFLLPFASSAAKEAPTKKPGFVLNSRSFSNVWENQGAWAVAFTNGPATPKFEREQILQSAGLAEAAGLVYIGTVDCLEEPALCASEGVTDSLPAAMMYRYYAGKKNGRRYGHSLVKAVSAAIKSVPDVTIRISERALEKAVEQTAKEQKLMVIFITHDEGKTPAWLKACALLFQHDLDVGVVHHPSKKWLRTFAIDHMELPGLALMIPVGKRMSKTSFRMAPHRGETNFEEVVMFMHSLSTEVWPQQYPSTEKRQGSVAMPRMESPPQPLLELTSTNQDEACKAADLCILGFVNGDGKLGSESAKQISILQKARMSGQSKMMEIYWVDANCHEDFAEKFGVDSYSVPSLAVWSRSNSIFVACSDCEDYSVDSVRTFLGNFMEEKHDSIKLDVATLPRLVGKDKCALLQQGGGEKHKEL